MRRIYRFLYLIYRVVFLLMSWSQRRFTPAGLGVGAGLLLTLVVGIDTEHNVDYQVFPVLFFLLVAALLFTGSFRARFTARRVLPRFASVGAPLRYTVDLASHSGKAQRGLALLETLEETMPAFHEWLAAQRRDERTMRSFRVEQRVRTNPFSSVRAGSVQVPTLEPGGETQVTLELTPTKRGLLHFKELVVARTDPLGLFRSFVRLPIRQKLLVLPKRYRLPPVALPGNDKYQEGGVAMASSVGQSEDFVSLRDYRNGDPMRHIHWRSWARVGKPVVKEFEDEYFTRHALVLDTFAEYDQGEVFEEAVSVAASYACAIQTQDSLLDLLFVGPESYCFTAGRGLAHADQMLEILASVRVCTDKPFSSLESLVVRHTESVSGCVCVFIRWDESRREFVRKLRMLNVPLLVLVVVLPGSPKPDPGPMQDEPEHFHILEAGDIERGLLAVH